MKKLIIAIVAGFMLSFAGTAAYAYPHPVETDVKPKVKGSDPKPGKKKRIIVKPRVQGDVEACTGNLKIIYKGGKKNLRVRIKPVAPRVPFNGRVPKGTTKIIFLYQFGKKDPCDKSRSSITI